MASRADSEPPDTEELPFDLKTRAKTARPKEVTSNTFSYVDALLTGRMTPGELGAIRADILAAPAVPSLVPPVCDLLSELELLFERRDFAGALRGAEAIGPDSQQYAAAQDLVARCSHVLAQAYQAHLGAGDEQLTRAVSLVELAGVSLSPWEAYALSLLDEPHSVDEVLDLVGLSRLDGLRLLFELKQRGLLWVAARQQRVHPDEPALVVGASDPAAAAVLARVKLRRRNPPRE